jgi:cellulose synthase/poly-beta-1,6-N-acetylglucosamine synthase-like glycosyltransferase
MASGWWFIDVPNLGVKKKNRPPRIFSPHLTNHKLGLSDVHQALFHDKNEAAAAHLNRSGTQTAKLRQWIGFAVMLLAFVVFFSASAANTYFWLTFVCVAASFPIFLSLGWPGFGEAIAEPACNAAEIENQSPLPFFTVLLPVLNEPNMLTQILDSIMRLDYPHDRLEVFLLVEANDAPTLAQAEQMAWPDFCYLVRVPAGHPKTKARACNYGLTLASGEFLVIFDAEDKVHPQQLRNAVHAFVQNGPELACVQAPLKIDVMGGAWLQYQFALEYNILFSLTLPVLSRLRAVMPLGGSSNYFRVACLHEVGGWDAYNLTEDADLGFRMAKHGFECAMIAGDTVENAPDRLKIWMSQRTRWLTGHIQTFCVHMRHPHATLRLLGWRRFAMINVMIIGRLLSGVIHGAYFIYLLQALPNLTDLHALGRLSVTLVFASVLFYVGYTHAANLSRREKVFLSLTQPFYWMLTSIALANACWRIARGQLDWLKTPHKPYS